MRFKLKNKNKKWKLVFAWKPKTIESHKVWLEMYFTNGKENRLYEGCAERVGYQCDCLRHD